MPNDMFNYEDEHTLEQTERLVKVLEFFAATYARNVGLDGGRHFEIAVNLSRELWPDVK
jgi:hypothetical protein